METASVGRAEHGGVPSQGLPDRAPPPAWRLDAVYATARPHHLATNGDRVAFVLDRDETTDLWQLTTPGGSLLRITTDRDLVAFWEDAAPVWSPDGSRIAYSSGGAVHVAAADGGPARRLTLGSPGAWIDDGRLVVVVEDGRTTRLAGIAVDDPWPQPFGPTGGDVGDVASTGDGRVVATFFPKGDRHRSDVVLADPAGEWRTLSGIPGRRAFGSAVHDTLVAYLQEEEEWSAVYLTDLDGSHHTPLARAEADFGDLSWSAGGRSLLATRTARGAADVVILSLGGDVTALTSGGSWQTPRWVSGDVVAVHESTVTPPRIVHLAADGTQRELFSGAPAAVRAAPHVAAQRVVFPSRDGLEIEGFLYRPRDATLPVPAVVYPHGGPTSVYGDEWDGHAQYFVDKGYAWLAVNFRGSTTYGLGFERANHGDWGVGDVEDCIAAARFLEGLGWVDAARIAVFGASYGSYLALASLVHPDNPFACGVAKYGDCNILTSWAQGDRVGGDDLERMMGHPSENREAYRRGSPVHDIERIDKPILVAHGEQDARVSPRQSEELVAALARLGKTYEYVTYPTEGHGLLRRDPQLDFYRRLERFLDWHLL